MIHYVHSLQSIELVVIALWMIMNVHTLLESGTTCLFGGSANKVSLSLRKVVI
jgi:hypothetical protein